MALYKQMYMYTVLGTQDRITWRYILQFWGKTITCRFFFKYDTIIDLNETSHDRWSSIYQKHILYIVKNGWGNASFIFFKWFYFILKCWPNIFQTHYEWVENVLVKQCFEKKSSIIMSEEIFDQKILPKGSPTNDIL